MKTSIKKLASYVPPESIDQVAADYGLKRVAKLAANENPYGTSPQVAAAVKAAVDEAGNWYPDGNATRLRQLIARKLEVKAENIVFGCGLDEIIALVSRVFLTPGDEVLVADPTFSEYELNATIEGALVKKVPVDPQTGANDLVGFMAAVTPRTKLIWLCNPNNPTGAYSPVEQIRQFMRQIPSDVLVLIDEAYIDFVTEFVSPSAIELLKEYDNLAIMRTFSKIYGLAGYRVGYIILDDQRARYLQAVRLPYNLNVLSQVAAQAAFLDQNFVRKVARKNVQQRIQWSTFLEQVGLRHYASQANFEYFEVRRADALAQELLRHGYQIRTGLQNGWLRITIGLPEDNQAMRQIVADFLSKIG